MEGELFESLRMVVADGENATHVIDAMKGNHPHLDPQRATLNSYAGGFLMHCPEFTYDQELHAPIHHPNSTWTIGSDTSWQATDSNCLSLEQDLASLSCLWDPTALVQQSLSAETQNFDYDNLSASSQGSSGELFESMPSSSTTQSELLDRFTATISPTNTSSNHQYPSAFSKTAIGSRGSSKKRRRHLNSKSFSDISIKRKTSTAQLKKSLARFQREIWSNKPFSNPLKTELRRLFDQFNDLFEREICPSDSFSAVTASSSAPQESESDSTFSNFQQSDASSNSATPRQYNHGYHEDDLMGDEPAESILNLKRFQCTFPKCNYSSDRQGDWERHEAKEKHWPQEQFMCLQCNIPTSDLEGNPMCRYCSFPFSMLGDARTHYLQCGFAREGAKTFRRKDHLCEHLRQDHGLTDMSERAKGWSFPIYSEWPRECGFCGIFFDTWEQRMIHIGRHYQNGAQRLSWKLPFPRPKGDVPHEPTFDPSDDDSDDEDDDDFNDGRLPQGKASHHSSLLTSSSSQPTNNALSTYQHNGFQTQGNHRSQSHLHSAYLDNQETLTLQRLVSRLPRCKPSLPLQRYLNDFEDTPYRLFTPASSQCSLEKDRTRDAGESRSSTNKSEVFHLNVRMLQRSYFPHIAGLLDNSPFTALGTCSAESTCSKAIYRCQIVGLSAIELILAAKKIFSILQYIGEPDSILEFRFSSKEQIYGDLHVLFDFTYQCVGLDLVYNAMLLPRPSQLQKVWNERIRNLHFRKYLSFRSSKHRPSPPLGIPEKDLRALLNVYQNDVRRYKVLTEDRLHSAASISQFNTLRARWYTSSKSDLHMFSIQSKCNVLERVHLLQPYTNPHQPCHELSIRKTQNWLWMQVCMVADAFESFHSPSNHLQSGVGNIYGFHVDLKPSDILVAPNGILTVTDFGQSTCLDYKVSTSLNLLLNSPTCCSPEMKFKRAATPGKWPGTPASSLPLKLEQYLLRRYSNIRESHLDYWQLFDLIEGTSTGWYGIFGHLSMLPSSTYSSPRFIAIMLVRFCMSWNLDPPVVKIEIESGMRKVLTKHMSFPGSLKELPETDLDAPKLQAEAKDGVDQIKLHFTIYNQRLDKFGRAIEGSSRVEYIRLIKCSPSSSDSRSSSQSLVTRPGNFFEARKIPESTTDYRIQAPWPGLYSLACTAGRIKITNTPIGGDAAATVLKPRWVLKTPQNCPDCYHYQCDSCARDNSFHSHALPDQHVHGCVSEKPKYEALSYSWDDQVMRKETREKHSGADLQNLELPLWRPWKNETSIWLDSVCINESQKPRGSSLFALKDFSRTATDSFKLERSILLKLKSRTISDADQAVQGSLRGDELFLEKFGLHTSNSIPADLELVEGSTAPTRKPVTSMTMSSPSTSLDPQIRDNYKKKPLPSLPGNKTSTQQHQNNTAPFVFEGPSALGDVFSCLVKHPSQRAGDSGQAI